MCVFIVVALSASYILSFRVHFCAAELEVPTLLKMSASLMSWLLTPIWFSDLYLMAFNISDFVITS